MDAHLSRMLNSSRQCRCCGATFAQLLSLACDRPDMCPEDLPRQDNSALLAETGDILTEDFCRLGDFYFVRCVVAIPLAHADDNEFVLGTWASVSSDDFYSYADMMGDQDVEMFGTRPAWLSNAIPPGEIDPVAGMLHVTSETEFPELVVSEPTHPLFSLQKHGAQLEELLELLNAYGHDLPSLIYDS